MNKKGALSGFEAISWVYRAIFVVAIALVLSFVFGMFIIDTVSVKSVHSMLFADHLFYDKNGFAYIDNNINRVYPGMIDLNKFSTALLEKNIVTNNPSLFAVKTTYNGEKETYYKKTQYDRWFPRRRILGPGGSQEFLIAKTALTPLFGSGTVLFSILSPNIW